MTAGPVHLEPEAFDELVSEVMDGLPEEWAPLLDNIAVVVEEEPAEDDIPADAPPGMTLFGLYRGVAVPTQFLGGGLAGPAMSAPPEIALFQGPLERASRGLGDLRERVRATLVHEVGHHFGYSEGRLREGQDNTDE
jgi:predicted Zn-dependent protease with MMP-like domain